MSDHERRSPSRDPGSHDSGQFATDYSALPLSSGEPAVSEAILLAQALVGCQPAQLETRLAVRHEIARNKIQLPGILHVFVTINGRDVGESWIEVRADGSGRSYTEHDVPDGGAGASILTVDIGDQLAQSRLSRLISVIGPIAAAQDLILLRNALAVCRRDELGEPEPALILLATELTDRYLEPILFEGTREWFNAITEMPNQPDLVTDILVRCRSEWSISATSAATMLAVGSLPKYCAEAEAKAGSSTTSVACFVRYLKKAVGAIILGDSVFSIVGDAVRDGYREAMGALASDFYAQAKEYSNAAMNGPAERVQFGRALAIAAPFALAAYQVAEQLNLNQFPSQWATPANELYVRLCGGLIFQWSDWISGEDSADLAEYAAAVGRGDKIAAWQVLGAGEDIFRRPRSARELFKSKGY